MKFVVASSSKCAVIEAENIDQALKKGMTELKEHPDWGNVAAIPVASTREEWCEQRRKLIVSSGEFFEYFGYPDRMYEQLIKHIEYEIDCIDAEKILADVSKS